MFDGILFDLDGTLWDSREGVCLSWNRVLAEKAPALSGRVTPERLGRCMGMLLRDIGYTLFPELPPEESDRLVEYCCREENEYLSVHGGILYPGVNEAFPILAGRYSLFIVSNCQDGYIESFFAAHGLEGYFRDWTCPGSTGQPKAENIRAIVDRHGLKRPVYVGDTQGDFAAATAAGVPFIHAAYGFGQVDGVPALRAFDRLPALLEELEKGT